MWEDGYWRLRKMMMRGYDMYNVDCSMSTALAVHPSVFSTSYGSK